MKNGTKVLLTKDYYEEGILVVAAGTIGVTRGIRDEESPFAGVDFEGLDKGMVFLTEELMEWNGSEEERDAMYPDRKKKIEEAI